MKKLFIILISFFTIGCPNDDENDDDTSNPFSTISVSICGDGIIAEDEECEDIIDNHCENCIKPRRVFVTDDTYTGLFMDKSNDLCIEQAKKANLTDYSWVSWVSLSEEDAKDKFYKSPFRYELLDGTIIADNYEELISGVLQHEININQYGEIINDRVWTGTNEFGEYSKYNCKDWLMYRVFGTYGSTSDKGLNWTNVGITECYNGLRLYCIEDKKL